MKIETVTVVGANGTMGRNMAGIFASFGNAKTYLVCRNIEDAERAVELAAKSVRADEIRSNLIACNYDNLKTCIEESDLIFESVSENIEVKRYINAIIDKYATGKQIIATGTSGLSIDVLSECFSECNKSNYIGLHFFNPPYAMSLCEVIVSKYTNKLLEKKLISYLENTLLRSVIEVKDSPAFLANRIGFQFINNALQLAEEYKDSGGIDYIDALLGGFTGRNMAPMITANFVGLDVHKAIVDNVFENTNDNMKDTFILPKFVLSLIKQGKLGKKTSEGLYKTIAFDNGIKEHYVYDILSNDYRKVEKYNFSFVTSMLDSIKLGDYTKAFSVLKTNVSTEARLCLKCLLQHICYAIKITKEIAFDLNAVDIAMATGFNWISPLALIELLGGKDEIKRLAKNTLGDISKNYDFDTLFEDLPLSKLDFRSFLKAKR